MPATDATLLDLPPAESTYREVDGVRLHAVAAGDPADPLVVLLHGFPDFWYGWHHQIPALVEAGYRVLVPDQRGYNLSDKPRGLDAYRLGRLASDVVALVESEGRESAHVIGHDWGGGVAWELALRHPDTVERLGIVNAAHPVAFRERLRSDPSQLRRSWYMFAFQLPRLPEWYLGRDGAANLLELLVESAHDDAFSAAELPRYRAAWQREGAVRAALDWYRASFRRPDLSPRSRVDAPTVVVWGDEDAAYVPELAEESARRCDESLVVRFPGASHWPHRERPGTVTDNLLDHLRA